MKKNIFKRFFAAFAVLTAMCFLLVSCNDSENEGVEKTSNASDAVEKVFVYSLNGISRYNYDNEGRIEEIILLDATTLSPYIGNESDNLCRYSYDDSGLLSGLIYLGTEFELTEIDEDSRPVAATANRGGAELYVKFTYNEEGFISKEEFYENGSLVLKNTFDTSNRPVTVDYTDIGSLKYDYSDTNVYITVSYDDPEKSSPDITIYLDDDGHPKYAMQMVDSVISATTWSYNENKQCVDTVIENTYNASVYTEEYIIARDASGKIEQINYFTPDSEGEPEMSGKYDYEYNGNGDFKSKTEWEYENNEAVGKGKTEYENGREIKVTYEKLKDGVAETTEVTEKQYSEDGSLTKKVYELFDINGSYISGTEVDYEYDSLGRAARVVTKNLVINRSVKTTFVEEYSYNSDNRKAVALYIAYSSDGSLEAKEMDEFEYDNKGNIVLQNVYLYDENEVLVNRTETKNTYTLSGALQLSKTTVYDAEGNVLSTE